ncbi:uncharacterized protein [Physcomitrium patens]|uniref:Uncharacterized protein n=1 Tax=Physcomitrium patens TaxID=3218 RepID=A0A2K1KT86_PHYPA|nr:uncharacterized protein LOC112280031 [Physcomitrium patens]PNR56978.1 hypothetical protein PHYPA_003971 [Physcomitrium patens]|eukprot:XP_024370720.1 uncharacterized protein LOC112280031 [Physcomitrella patens]
MSSKRKHSSSHSSRDPSTPKRSQAPASPQSRHLPLLQLESEIADLGAKVSAYREKGLSFFAALSEARVRKNQEETACPAPTKPRSVHEDQRQALKERLALANKMLPTLLKDLAMWNTKIQQAVDVKRKDQRLPFLDSVDAET